MQSRVEPFVVGPIVGTAGQTSIRILGVMPAGTLKAGQKAPHGRIRWRLEGETRWRGPRHFRINGNFDSSGVVVLKDLLLQVVKVEVVVVHQDLLVLVVLGVLVDKILVPVVAAVVADHLTL